MGKANKNKDEKIPKIMIELNVSMHCNACERSIAKAISKLTGVEKFITDMPRNRAVVFGRIKPEKIENKIKKKTGKRIRILVCEKLDSDDPSDKKGQSSPSHETSNSHMKMESLECLNSDVYTMFNDENANACSVM